MVLSKLMWGRKNVTWGRDWASIIRMSTAHQCCLASVKNITLLLINIVLWIHHYARQCKNYHFCCSRRLVIRHSAAVCLQGLIAHGQN